VSLSDKPRYFDFDGNPISLEVWSALFENFEKRRVGHTITPSGYHVSTVWLGADHGFGRTIEPLIYESMVFSGGDTSEDEDCRRYATREQAIKGHWELVKEYGGEAPTKEVWHPYVSTNS
jgi:hypothetical protein